MQLQLEITNHRSCAQWQIRFRIGKKGKFLIARSLQTASAFVRTLKCHVSLIEDLLAEGYDFIMTSRFQSDPLERRFGQYRQMSGGRFLVGPREATSSEKIIELKTILWIAMWNMIRTSRLSFMLIFPPAQTKWLHFLMIIEK